MQLEDYYSDWTGRIVSNCHYYRSENKKYAIVLEDKREALQFYNSMPSPSGYEYHAVKILWLKQKSLNTNLHGKTEIKIKKYLNLEK